MELIKNNPIKQRRPAKRITEIKEEPDFKKVYDILVDINDSVIMPYKNSATLVSMRSSIRTHAKIQQQPNRKYKFKDNKDDTFTIYRIA